MQNIYYDLHIHSALSPCADDDMTPNDIVGMALLNGLDMIAVTDHNSFANVEAVIAAAANRLIVLPGAEISTAEEVHVLCLFDEASTALRFESALSPYYSTLINREDIFGAQLLYDSEDNLIGKLNRMLAAPTTISFDDLYKLTHEFGGAFVPAHVDRGAFSVSSNLGFLPPDLDISTVQFTSRSDMEISHNFSLFPDKKYIFSSDAHQLWVINERKFSFPLPEYSAKAAIDYLK